MPTKPDSRTPPLADMLVAIGSALSNWQHVEAQVARVCLALITTDKKHRAASAAFHSVLSFRTKLDMTTAAAMMALDEPNLAEWRTLANRLDRKAKKRNELAHFSLVQDVDLDGQTLVESYTLETNVWDAARHVRKKDGPFVLKPNDIRNRAQAFRVIAEEVGAFADRLEGQSRRRRPAAQSAPPKQTTKSP